MFLRCTCKPKSSCTVQDCPFGLRRRVHKLATGYPGNCCDQFDCINGMPSCYSSAAFETTITDGTIKLIAFMSLKCSDIEWFMISHCASVFRCS